MSEKQIVSCNQNEDQEYSREDHFNEILTGGKITHFYLNGDISEESKWYFPALHLFNNASGYDEIYLHLNSPGGNLFNMVQILNAINTCAGNVHLIVEGECSSAGSMIAFGGKYKSIQISDLSIFLFHTPTAGKYARLDMAKSYLKGVEKWSNVVHRQCYQGILTEVELNQLEEGAEIYLLASDVKARLKDRYYHDPSDTKKKSSKKES